MVNYSEIANRIKRLRGIKRDREIAELFGISPADYLNRKKRGSLMPLIIEWAIHESVNIHWLLTGQGPMKIEEPQEAVAVSGVKPSRKNYADILRMTAEIMESGSIYADALKSNVAAFHHAVVREALPAMETSMERRIKEIIENELRLIRGKNDPPGERTSDSSRKEGAASDPTPEGPELGKMGM